MNNYEHLSAIKDIKRLTHIRTKVVSRVCEAINNGKEVIGFLHSNGKIQYQGKITGVNEYVRESNYKLALNAPAWWRKCEWTEEWVVFSFKVNKWIKLDEDRLGKGNRATVYIVDNKVGRTNDNKNSYNYTKQ